MTFASIYVILVGFAIIGYWIIFYLRKQTPGQQIEAVVDRGQIEMRFHIIAELLAAVVLIIAGTSLLMKISWGREVVLVAIGMLLYTSVNSAGYFAQIRQQSMIIIFAFVLILSVVSLVIVL
jgi:hypothetical protein